jgi:hypothetical protein
MTADADTPNEQVTSPDFANLVSRVSACTRDEKRALVYRLLQDLVGDKPDREYVLAHPDGSSFLFLIPPHSHVQRSLTPERLAEFERRGTAPAQPVSFTELLAHLEAAQEGP